MFSEIFENLRQWSELNSAIAVTAALAAMSCALPGVWLVLRRHSMLGDALAHAALPGVVAAFLVTYAMKAAGWVSPERFDAVLHLTTVLGAVAAGLLTAWLTEAIQRLGRIDSGAALGVVFTCLFAMGLLLMRLAADNVHIDPDCALFGILEATALDTVTPQSWLPQAAVSNAIVLAVNLLLTVLFFKELRVAAFDPSLATTQGIPAGVMHYVLLSATAVAAATAFSTVGSILVIGLLIVPAATAQLLTTRLWVLIALSLVLAAACAVAGHAVAMAAPGPIFSRLGFSGMRDAGTAGMIAVVAGVVFTGAIVLAPQSGLVTRVLDRFRVAVRIAADDVLGGLYRQEEAAAGSGPGPVTGTGVAPWITRFAGWRLSRHGLVQSHGADLELTVQGRVRAQELVRSHRVYEAFLDQNFPLPPDQLHLSADRVEHVLDPALREALAAELPETGRDPHGREIPDAPEKKEG
jgi:manganese/zinc/iron transport system permease protein